MAKIDASQKKWEEKTEGKGSVWKAAAAGKGDEWCKAVADFMGVGTCNKALADAFNDGIDRVSASDFNAAVHGKGPKWKRRYIEKVSGVGVRRARGEE